MFVSLDLETTGFGKETDKIIEFGAIKFDLEGNSETLQFLCNPGFKIPDIVVHITKITDEDIKDANPFSKHIEEVQNFIGDLPIIGHNIQFDTGFLEENGVEIKNLLYDTHDLSAIILPNMTSYSLEILSKVFELQHTDKHRALDDAIAAMELFLKLKEGFESLDPELLEKIKKLTEKSDWDFKNFLKNLKHSEKKSIIHPPKEEDFNSQKDKFKLIEENSDKKIFKIAPPYEKLSLDLAKSINKECYISIPYQIFRDIYKQIPDNIAKIDNPKHYISLERLEKFQNKDHFETHEILALLKYLAWVDQTETGLLNEVRIVKKEKSTIKEINIDKELLDPENEKFFKKALERDEKLPAICSHEFFVNNPVENSELIIIDFENFKKNIFRANSVYLDLEKALSPLQLLPQTKTIENLISKTTILFGLLGIIFEKHNDSNKYASRSTLTEFLKETKEWKDAQSSLLNLIGESKNLGKLVDEKTKGILKKWKKILTGFHQILFAIELEKSFIWIEKNYEGIMVARKIPSNIDDNIKEILEKTTNYKIITENLPIFSHKPEETYIESINIENLEIILGNNIDERDKNQIPNFLKEFLKENKKTAVICNSKKVLEYLTTELSKANIEIVSQATASIGKLHELFKSDRENCSIFMTPNTWKVFKYHENIDNLIILKTPFTPPSDPNLIAISKESPDPFNEIQIPKAMTELEKMINRLLKDNINPKKLIILDPRLLTKNYGQGFIEALNRITKTQSVNLASLLNQN